MVFYDNTAVVTTACNACSGAKMDSSMGMGGGMGTMMGMGGGMGTMMGMGGGMETMMGMGGGMYGNLATSGVDDDVRSVIKKAVGLGTKTIRRSTMTAVDFAKKIGMVNPGGAVNSAVMDTIELLKGDIQDSISIVKSTVDIPRSIGMSARDVVMFFRNMRM